MKVFHRTEISKDIEREVNLIDFNFNLNIIVIICL